MSEEFKATLIGLGVAFALRALDWLFPSGHHAKFVRRYGTEDTDEEDT